MESPCERVGWQLLNSICAISIWSGWAGSSFLDEPKATQIGTFVPNYPVSAPQCPGTHVGHNRNDKCSLSCFCWGGHVVFLLHGENKCYLEGKETNCLQGMYPYWSRRKCTVNVSVFVTCQVSEEKAVLCSCWLANWISLQQANLLLVQTLACASCMWQERVGSWHLKAQHQDLLWYIEAFANFIGKQMQLVASDTLKCHKTANVSMLSVMKLGSHLWHWWK